jgi:hypothetical protein
LSVGATPTRNVKISLPRLYNPALAPPDPLNSLRFRNLLGVTRVSRASRQYQDIYVDPAGYRWAAVWFGGTNKAPLTKLYLRDVDEGPGPATHSVTLVCRATEVKRYLRMGSRIPMPIEGETVEIS